jgi:hypothetical protein
MAVSLLAEIGLNLRKSKLEDTFFNYTFGIFLLQNLTINENSCSIYFKCKLKQTKQLKLVCKCDECHKEFSMFSILESMTTEQ